MMVSRPNCPLSCPSQADLDVLLRDGVDIMSVATPLPMQVAFGAVAHDGLFDPEINGSRWFAFEEPDADDIILWRRQPDQTASWNGHAFALGQGMIDAAATYVFDCALNIFASPLDWLRARRDGIVVLDWTRAFDRLRDAPRIAIAEELLPLYRRHMKPARMPELFVVPSRRRAA